MPLPLIRYPLDPTGWNADNRIVGETHTLTARAVRAAAPLYGTYFTESLVVYDDSTNRLLVRNVDYQCGELLQAATLRFGHELCLLILVTNPAVSERIRITYQCLGGDYQHDASGILTLYETAMQDNRAVDWTQILNKPDGYSPTLHRHLLEDVIGYEPIVNALERIRYAILLGDVPAYEALIDWVNTQITELRAYYTGLINAINARINALEVRYDRLISDLTTRVDQMQLHYDQVIEVINSTLAELQARYDALLESIEERLEALQLRYDELISLINQQLVILQQHVDSRNNPHNVTLAQLGYRLATRQDVMEGGPGNALVPADVLNQILNEMCFRSCFRLQVAQAEAPEGQLFSVAVQSTNVANDAVYYWSIEHVSSDDSDFSAVTGTCVFQNNQSRFDVMVVADPLSDIGDAFYIRLHSDSASGPIVARSIRLVIVEDGVDIFDSFIQLLADQCLFSDLVVLTPETFFFSQSL